LSPQPARNNCFAGQAVDNARQMAALLRQRAPALEVVEASAAEAPAVRQPSLFDTPA
jgi:hypothetical protein